jgi:hypothetical protein
MPVSEILTKDDLNCVQVRDLYGLVGNVSAVVT